MTDEEIAEIHAYLEQKGVITPQARRHVLPIAVARARMVAEHKAYEARPDAPPPTKDERLMKDVWYDDDQRLPGARPLRSRDGVRGDK